MKRKNRRNTFINPIIPIQEFLRFLPLSFNEIILIKINNWTFTRRLKKIFLSPRNYNSCLRREFEKIL